MPVTQHTQTPTLRMVLCQVSLEKRSAPDESTKGVQCMVCICADRSATPDVTQQYHTFKALERLKQLNQRCSAQLLVVLGGNLNTNLKVLSDVVCKHGLQTLHGILDR